MTQPKPLALTHLVRRPLAGRGAPPLLLLLHGVGSNEHDLFSMAPYLDRRFLIVSTRAPYVLGPGSYAWFELGFTPNGIVIDPRQAEASRKLIVQFIAEAVATYDADPRRVYLMGFSQGAMMSGWVALTRPDLVAGVVMMSGRIEAEMLPTLAPAERLTGLPILVVHGTLDTVLPIQHGRASRDILAGLPVDLTYREYPMGHEVNAESLAEIVNWLSARLDQTSRV
jgi:phospholipase/carboxylesterase